MPSLGVAADGESLTPSPLRNATAGGAGSGYVPGPSHVQHYAVAHFRAIRQMFGISAESFAAAFKRAVPASDDSARRLRESVSEGATGSFFYWVKHPDGSDTGYIVKQVCWRGSIKPPISPQSAPHQLHISSPIGPNETQ